MDLSPTAEQEAFRGRCREWLQANLPWEYGKGLPPHFDDLAEEVAFLRDWQRQLAGGGWVGVTWPTEYGGQGAGALLHYVVSEELARARAPELVGRIGINLVGPTLLAHGTDRAEGALAAGHPRRRRPCGASCSRAERRERPRVAVDEGRAGRRRGRVAHRGPEGVDVLRAVRRLGAAARPHRPGRVEAPGHHGVRDRHAAGGRRRPSAAPDHRRVRLQRGLLRWRVRARRRR